MTSVSPAGDVRTAQLSDGDRVPLLRLLEDDSPATVYLRSLVHEHGVDATDELAHGRFYGFWRDDVLRTVVFASNARNMSTFGDPLGLAPLMDQILQGPVRPRLFVGPEDHAPAVRRGLFRDGFRARLDRRQRYYVMAPTDRASLEEVPLRPASHDDLDTVVRAHADMIREDLEIPTANLDLSRLRELAKRRVDEEKIWVVTEGKHLVFKTEEISRSREGVLVGGVYTHPDHRGRGLASRGMATWATRLFTQDVRLLALHVNDGNVPAYRAYERAGFRRYTSLRLILSY